MCCAKFFITLMRTLISAKQVISPWPLIFGRSKVKVPSESPHHQNLTISSLDHDQYFLKASLQSGHNFWSYFAKRQTNAGGHIISSLGGGNYVNFLWPLFNLVLSTSLWRTVTHSLNKCNKQCTIIYNVPGALRRLMTAVCTDRSYRKFPGQIPK